MTQDRDKDPPAPIERASGGQANADRAADAAPGERKKGEDLEERQDQLLDEAVEESFPASDPAAQAQVMRLGVAGGPL